MDESRASVKFSGPLVDTIPEEIWDKVAADLLRGFVHYRLADPIPWGMQPQDAQQKFKAFVKDLTERLYRSDIGADPSRVAHEASRALMTEQGWVEGLWDERVKAHPDMKNWNEISDTVRIKYALMVLMLSATLKFHGYPVLIHLLP